MLTVLKNNEQPKEIFPSRTITIRMRLFQSIWFVNTGLNYEIQHRLNAFGKLAYFVVGLIQSIGLFLLMQFGEIGPTWETLLNGGVLRKDFCRKDVESTDKLIELAGWE